MLFPKVSSALRIRCFLSHVLSSRVSSLVFPLCVCFSSVVCRFVPLFVAFFSCSLLHCLRFFSSCFLLHCFFLTFLFWLIFPFPSVCVCCFLFVLITRHFLLFFCCFSLLLCCFVVQLKPAEMGQSKTPITAVNRPIREK